MKAALPFGWICLQLIGLVLSQEGALHDGFHVGRRGVLSRERESQVLKALPLQMAHRGARGRTHFGRSERRRFARAYQQEAPCRQARRVVHQDKIERLPLELPRFVQRSDTRVGRNPKPGRGLFKRQVDENVGRQRVPWVGG